MNLEPKPNPMSPNAKAWCRRIFFCGGLIGVGLVIFFSWRNSPAISTLKWVPRWLSNWTDRNGRLDNLPAYGLVAVPFLLITPGFRRQAAVAGGLVLLVVVLELGQLAIPTRHCDPGDMVCGGAGILLAWAGCAAIRCSSGRWTAKTRAEG